MIRASTYRVRPGTRRREDMLASIAGANRYVWNWAVRNNKDQMKAHEEGRGDKPKFTYFHLCKEFTALRADPELDWLRELPFEEVRYALNRYAAAMREAVQGKRGFPKFKHKEDGDNFTIPSSPRIKDGRLWVTKLGWVPITRRGGDPWAHGKAKQAVVHKTRHGRWYVSIFWEVPDEVPAANGRACGIDMNCGQVAFAGSDGTSGKWCGPNTARLEARARRYARRMARRQRVPLLDEAGEPRRTQAGKIIKRNSGRRERARLALAKTLRELAMTRQYWAHGVSARLASRFGLCGIEDLRVKDMTKSAKGTAEEPGRNVRQKTSLNRSILSTGWGALARMLDYKARRIERVSPAYTSQTCNRCGHTAVENRKTQAAFKCTACGHVADADINAARNILARATADSALVTGAAGRGADGPERTGPSRKKDTALIRQLPHVAGGYDVSVVPTG